MDYCFFLTQAVASQSSKKQRIISTLTIKMEYIVLGHTARNAIWIKKFINKMELKAAEDITLYSNNKISIVLTKNAKNQYQTKHINVQYHYI